MEQHWTTEHPSASPKAYPRANWEHQAEKQKIHPVLQRLSQAQSPVSAHCGTRHKEGRCVEVQGWKQEGVPPQPSRGCSDADSFRN